MPTRRHLLAAGLGSVVSGVSAQGGKAPLRYLQIGTGHPHADKIGVYRESPEWEVVGVVEPDPKRVESARKSKNFADLPFLTLEQGLNLPGLKAVGIETEVRDLLHHAELAIDAGFHIHLDKPAGESLEHFRRILGKADRAGLTVQMGYMYRFNPAVQFLRECLGKGWLGEVFEVHTVMSKVIPTGPSRQELDDYPGGVMFELGGHIVDLVVGVLGRPDAVKAYPRRVITDAGDTLVDNMLAVFEYPRATATVKSTAVEVEGGARRHFVVCGTEGTCHIQPLDRPAIRLALSKDRDGYRKGYQDIPFEPPYQRYVGDAADLAAIIRGEKASEWPSGHDLAVQESLLLASGLDPATSTSKP
jgi:predicted dehydrogenase